MNDSMNRGFGTWPHPPPPPPAFAGGRKWKRKNPGATAAPYKPPSLKEMQLQNRAKARRFYPKKKFSRARAAPSAPWNTTSFIIRAKKAGGIPSLVSPCPVTPAILPTPRFSPSREDLVDMVKEEWGVDGYGSMKGLIRLRPGGGDEELEDGDGDGDSDSDVEAERRLDHDLSRFEMVYPNAGGEDGASGPYLLDNRVDDQDTHIARLEEENLSLKERMFLMEREMEDLRRRLMAIEARNGGKDGKINNDEDDGGGDVCSEKSVGGDGEEINDNETVTLMNE